MSGKNNISEESLRRKEAQIPRLARLAAKKACQEALDSGQKVLLAESGVLYEVSKTGRRRVKALAPRTRVKPGKTIKLS